MLWLPCVLNNQIRWAILVPVGQCSLEPPSCLLYTLQKTLVVVWGATLHTRPPGLEGNLRTATSV